jgi:dipeptidyl-peptidase-4
VTSEISFLHLQARTQRFTLGSPREFRVSPDGTRVLFLRSRSGEDRNHGLWRIDTATGEETLLADPDMLLGAEEELPPEERARRERRREQAGGIIGNTTDRDARICVFALSGRLFVADAVTGETRELPTPTPIVDPRPDPTGRLVAYVSANALRVVGVDGTGDRALAEPEGEDRAYGLAEFIAAEEIGRTRGYWWSPDGTRLLVSHTDRRRVLRWHIADPANPAVPANTIAYPAAGTDNVDVRLVLIDTDGNRTDIDWDTEDFPYLTTVHWSEYGPPLIAVQSRDQRRVQIRSVRTEDGATELVHEETDPQWIEVVPGVPAWMADGRLVWVTARDGAYRIMIGDDVVTGPPLQVRSVLDVGKDDVLFTASEEDPTQVHVYRVDATGPHRLSTVDGVHSATRSGEVMVLTSWAMDRSGPLADVLHKGEKVAEVVSHAVVPPLAPKVTLLTVGARKLRAALLFPTGHQPGSRKLPVLLDPYGGPHAQRVLQSRNAFLNAQWMADQGFAVLIADGRGTPGRGPAWDRDIAFDFAGATLADQVDALHAVADRYQDLDLSKVAIRGWSYGGYLSALAVLRRPDVFHAAIAGAPVTDWRLYDTHYTERYLGHPDEYPDVYDRNSLLLDAPNLRRPLLLIHGIADDNVVFAHSVRLSSALVAAGKPHTLLPLPGVTHMTPQEEDVAANFLLLQFSWLKQALGLETA